MDTDEAPLGDETVDRGPEGLVADSKPLSERRARERAVGEGVEDALVQGFGDGDRGDAVDDEPGWVAAETHDQWVWRPVAAVLDDERRLPLALEQVGVAVAPGMKVPRPAEGLAGLGGARLADVMDEHDGDVVLALECAQVAEDVGDVAG